MNRLSLVLALVCATSSLAGALSAASFDLAARPAKCGDVELRRRNQSPDAIRWGPGVCVLRGSGNRTIAYCGNRTIAY